MIKILHSLHKYKAMTAVTVLALFIQAFGTLYIPTLMSDIVNNGILNGDLPYIYSVGGKMVLVSLFTAAFAVCGAWTASSLSARWGMDIRNDLFRHTQAFSLRDFNRFGAASMITRCTNDISNLQDTLIVFFLLMLPAPIIAIGGLILAFSKDPVMALFIIGAVGALILLSALLFKKVIPLYHRLRLDMDEMNRVLRERITGVRVIRAFNQGGRERERSGRIFTDYGETSIRVNELFAVMMPFVLIVINLCTLCILWFGGGRAAAGLMQIGDIMALIEYAMLIFWNLVMGVAMLVMIPKAQACAERINEVISLEPDVTDGAQVLFEKADAPVLEFRDVTFQYDHAEEPVLSNLNFSCRRGQTTAIIGGTGSGKSTIASLIMRFYDIQNGSILFDGTDIRSVSQASLRDRIGFVPQKSFLFSGTVAENLRHGNRTADAEDLKRAAAIAQADDFLSEKQDGYDAYVAQGGANFSGGQRQRLCIARALAKHAELYLFDDSFSALDFKTDARLRAALKREVTDAAIVVVAQRVSSIVDADQIIVLDNGGIAAIGTHSQLLESCRIYREIVKSQMKEEAI